MRYNTWWISSRYTGSREAAILRYAGAQEKKVIRMAKTTDQRLAKASQWMRVGMMTATLARPALDQFWRTRQAKQAEEKHPSTVNLLARVEEQLPLTQQQLEKLAKTLSDRVVELSGQAQKTAGKVRDTVNPRAWWITGISLGFVAAGATAFVVTRRRMRKSINQPEDLVAIPNVATNGHHAPSNRLRQAMTRITQRGAPGATAETAPGMRPAAAAIAENDAVGAARTEVASAANFVGNIHSLIYHPADSDHLPAEEHRVYFNTEAEARAAGYRPASGE
jgi:hypothetical protein